MRKEEEEDAGRPASDAPPARGPLGYYYDDGTGYEVYRPEEEDEDDEKGDDEKSDGEDGKGEDDEG